MDSLHEREASWGGGRTSQETMRSEEPGPWAEQGWFPSRLEHEPQLQISA